MQKKYRVIVMRKKKVYLDQYLYTDTERSAKIMAHKLASIKVRKKQDQAVIRLYNYTQCGVYRKENIENGKWKTLTTPIPVEYLTNHS